MERAYPGLFQGASVGNVLCLPLADPLVYLTTVSKRLCPGAPETSSGSLLLSIPPPAHIFHLLLNGPANHKRFQLGT